MKTKRKAGRPPTIRSFTWDPVEFRMGLAAKGISFVVFFRDYRAKARAKGLPVYSQDHTRALFCHGPGPVTLAEARTAERTLGMKPGRFATRKAKA